MAEEVLRIAGLHAYYGESHVLHGVDCHVERGEVVTLLGRNGAGRTTTMKALLGLVGSRSGSVRIHGSETIGLPPHRIAALGVGLVLVDRPCDRLILADDAVIRPCRRDVAGLQVLRSDRSDRLDVTLLVPRPLRLGEVRQRRRGDQRQAQLVSRLQEHRVEQGAIIASLVEIGCQAL